MALSISFYNDIKYTKDDFMNRDRDFFGNGVVNATDFPLTFPATPNMTFQAGPGTAWVDGYRIANDTNLITLTVQPANTQPRIDIVQIGHDDFNSVASLVVKTGIPATSPIEPGADPGYLKLYAISVSANATSIATVNVTDRRNLVPLKVSGTQISFQGSATTGTNTFTGTQTAPEFVATSQTAPLQLPNLNALPQTVGTAGTVCIVQGHWYMSDGTQWNQMAPTLPGDMAKLDVAQTWTAAQTFGTGTTMPWVGVNGTPTTLAGYGITDAVKSSQLGTNSGVATLDSNGHLTASQLSLPSDVAKTDVAQAWTAAQTFNAAVGMAEGSTLAGRTSVPNYDQYMSNPDSYGIYTTLQLKRPSGGTLYMQSVLTNPDANGNYQTDTWTFYANDGVTVTATHVWSITWDSKNKAKQKVMTA